MIWRMNVQSNTRIIYMPPRYFHYAFLCAVAICSAPAYAEEAATDDLVLEGLVVTATRKPDDALVVPAAVDVIPARDIQRAQPQINLSETLKRVPGVVARDRQNYAQDEQISIRGFGAR
ncbi:MAG: TonB-dependent receptor plug domain-containing protein, partial [Solimonas sp.]